MAQKIIIYQLFVRLFGNKKKKIITNGSLTENGCGTFADINTSALDALKALGISHLWLTGVLRHASGTAWPGEDIQAAHVQIVKGVAGSPYAVSDYFDVCPDLAHQNVSGRMQAFESLIIRCKKADMKVLIDLIPNHLAREYKPTNEESKKFAFGQNDNTNHRFSIQNDFYYLPNEHFVPPTPLPIGATAYHEYPAKATGNDCFSPNPHLNDWYETIKLNYGIDYQEPSNLPLDLENNVPSVWSKMLGVCLFWAGKGVDGFRCDMVELTPVAFWNWIIPRVHNLYPDFVFIAEIYNTKLYHSYKNTGFGLLYDKSGLYDIVYKLTKGTRAAMELDNLHYAQLSLGEGADLLTFMENHDEQRIASAHFGGSASAAWPGMVLSCTFSRSAVMIYNGQESGETGDKDAGFSGDDGKTSIFDYVNMPNHQLLMGNNTYDLAHLPIHLQVVHRFYSRLLNICKSAQVLTQGRFFSLQAANTGNSWDYDENRTYSFLRFTLHQKWLIVCNFEQTNTKSLHIKIPLQAFEQMQISHDAQIIFKPIFSSEPPKNTANVIYTIQLLADWANVKAGFVLNSLPMQGYIFEILTV